MEFYITRLLLGLVIGFVIGLTGVGGGVLVVPALNLLLGLPASVAVGTASLYSFLTKIVAVFEHFKLKTIDFSISLLFLLGAVPGTIVASLVVIYLANQEGKEKVAQFQSDLKLLIAWVMLVSVVLILFDLFGRSKTRSRAIKLTRAHTIGGICSGFFVGLLFGTTSVGGGVFVVPLLLILFGMTSQKTVGSSLLIAVVLTFLKSLLFLKGDNLDYEAAILMALGSLPGIFWGSRVSIKISDVSLKKIIVAVISLATIAMFI